VLRGDRDLRDVVEASSPTLAFDTIRLLFYVAGKRTILADVSKAYLNAKEDFVKFLIRPPVHAADTSAYWALHSAVYGGKDADLLWSVELSQCNGNKLEGLVCISNCFH